MVRPIMVLLERCRLDGEGLFGSSCPRASPSRAKLDLPDGKSSGDASGIVEPKLHRALFPSSRRDSGEGTRHSALQNAKEARTLLISLVFIPLHRGLALLLLLPSSPVAISSPSHLAGRHSFPPHRQRSPIRESAYRRTLESTLSSRTSPDLQRRSTLDSPSA